MTFVNPQLKAMYAKNNKFFIVLAVLIFVIFGIYDFVKYKELSKVQADVKLLSLIDANITKESPLNTKEFTEKRETLSERRKEYQNEISKVFPLTAEQTTVTRMIDDYFKRNSAGKDDFFLKSIVFGNATATEQFVALPMQLSVTSSKQDFINFLKFVETSGAIKSNSRVMEVESVDVTLRSEESGNDIYDYRIGLNVFYQNSTNNEAQ